MSKIIDSLIDAGLIVFGGQVSNQPINRNTFQKRAEGAEQTPTDFWNAIEQIFGNLAVADKDERIAPILPFLLAFLKSGNMITANNTINAINLVEASLDRIEPYDPNKIYSPEEREPYDALSDRFVRSIEICLKFFKGYERYMYAENLETLRDQLNRMEKLNLISSVLVWMQMRDVRNRIVHDYLPEEIKDIYTSIMGTYGNELKSIKEKIGLIKNELTKDE